MNNGITVQQQPPMVPMSDMEKMAAAIAKSGLFGMKKVEEVLALMLIAQAEGRHPAEAARDYHIIQGRPALKADAMLARFQATGGRVNFTEYGPEVVKGIFTHPASDSPLTVSWSMKDAKRANLGGDNWRKYPRQMLKARVISEGVRAVFPAVTIGIYTKEEVEDMATEHPQIAESTVTTTPLPAEQIEPSALKPWIETGEGVKYHKFFDDTKESIGEPAYYVILGTHGCSDRTGISDKKTAKAIVADMRSARKVIAGAAGAPYVRLEDVDVQYTDCDQMLTEILDRQSD